MKLRLVPQALLALVLTSVLPLHAADPKAAVTPGKAAAASATGWLHWRGPDQNGTSAETGLPDKIDAKDALWTADFPGQSNPVIANGKLYINGYVGDGPDLQEAISCFDAETGKQLWQHRFNDFLSDIIYLRYATSAPTVDPETGNVYMQGTQGILACFTADGKLLWEHSMMEEFGRLTFPNARTASPVVDKELVITRGITSNWGAQGPAGDRFYAFDKKTGELVWSSSPGERPQDNTFSPPFMTWIDGMRVLISAAGDSSVLGINARTGDPLFRFPAAKAGAKGGINAGVIRYKDSLLVIHESENIDSSEVGRTARYKLPQKFTITEPGKPQQLVTKELEMWRNPLGNLASSPALVGNILYLVSGVGEVAAINVDSGKVLWRKKLAPEQRQSSPLYAEGKLYVALYTAPGQTGAEGAPAAEPTSTGGNGELFVLKPGATDAEILSRTILEGRCYGSPIAYNGKLYVQTDRKLYAFGKKGANKGLPAQKSAEEWPKPGAAAKLQVIPNELRLRPGESVALRARTLDSKGFTVEENVDLAKVTVETFIPPTALVKTSMKGTYAGGKMTAAADRNPSAGAFMAKLGNLSGTLRGRVLVDIPLEQDFEAFEIDQMTGPGLGGVPASTEEPSPAQAAVPTVAAAVVQPNPTNWNVVEPPTPFAYPPLPWNGARFRFEVRKSPGTGDNKALVKSIDHKLFQRGQIFIGHPEESNYTIEADVMTEGNRRKMSEVGLINQRYLIVLKGNAQQLEVNSNQERLRESVPFKWSPNEWYRLKARVDVAADGAGVIRAKAWKKGEQEPEAWNIEVPHKVANKNGCPGFFSLAPQEQRAWIDNIKVVSNK
jgi:outer membrane protein assembly factor BamB